MRFPITYYLMLLYLTVMFQPLIPVLGDLYAHVFDESIHLATVHAKLGSRHLETALAHSGSENDHSKNHKGSRVEEPFSIHLNVNQPLYNFSLHGLRVKHILFILSKLPADFASIIAPPPKASFQPRF